MHDSTLQDMLGSKRCNINSPCPPSSCCSLCRRQSRSSPAAAAARCKQRQHGDSWQMTLSHAGTCATGPTSLLAGCTSTTLLWPGNPSSAAAVPAMVGAPPPPLLPPLLPLLPLPPGCGCWASLPPLPPPPPRTGAMAEAELLRRRGLRAPGSLRLRAGMGGNSARCRLWGRPWSGSDTQFRCRPRPGELQQGGRTRQSESTNSHQLQACCTIGCKQQ